MNKNQKLLLGVAVVGIGGYLLWRSTQKKKFAGFMAPTNFVKSCCGHTEKKVINGNDVYLCCNGKDISPKSAGNPCSTCTAKIVTAASE